MDKSEYINELAKALSQAQRELKNAVRDADNPFFKSRYATLSSVWDACRDSLSKYGLSVSQGTDMNFNLITLLMHESGQWIKTVLALPLTKKDIQALGSEITYARRYALAAIIGVAVDDDDGNQAVKPQEVSRPVVQNFAPKKITEPKKDNSLPSEVMSNPAAGSFQISFGKHTGKMLKDIPDLIGWIKYMRSTESPGKELKGKARDAVEMAESYLGITIGPKVSQEPPFDDTPMPKFDDREVIPF